MENSRERTSGQSVSNYLSLESCLVGFFCFLAVFFFLIDPRVSGVINRYPVYCAACQSWGFMDAFGYPMMNCE